MATDKKKADGDGTIDQTMIRELANILVETDLTEIEFEFNGTRVRVSRQGAVVAAAAAPFPMTQAQPAPVQAHQQASAAPAAEESAANNPGVVKSPMVGTAYLAPEPGASPFVREGDTVSEGQTVMIVEAMKTMNNIPAHRSGTVKTIFVSNAQPVEYNEPLLLIE